MDSTTMEGRQVAILLVEDDAEIRDVLHLALEMEGYAVTCAINGCEGLARLAELHPDLIVTDQMMPVMTGIEMAQAIRDTPDGVGLPILMMSGYLPQAVKPGPLVDVLLHKPVPLDDLLAAIESLTNPPL